MQFKPWRWMAGFSLVVLILLAGCQANSKNAVAAAKATTGPVRIVLDHSAYGVSDPIGVTVSNVSKDLYYTIDGKSACTMLELQQYDSAKKQWAMVSGCTIAEPLNALQMPAGISEPFSLTPGSSSNEDAWQSGTYRVAVLYSANPDGKTDAQTAYSATFAIR